LIDWRLPVALVYKMPASKESAGSCVFHNNRKHKDIVSATRTVLQGSAITKDFPVENSIETDKKIATLVTRELKNAIARFFFLKFFFQVRTP
jgi:hypothetical protein